MSSAADAVAAGLPAWWRARSSAAIAEGADADAIETALRLPGERAPWTVYAVRFACGAAYVGLTGQMAFYRLFNHFGGTALGDPGTLSIQAEVDAGCAYRCDVLASGRPRARTPRDHRPCEAVERLGGARGALHAIRHPRRHSLRRRAAHPVRPVSTHRCLDCGMGIAHCGNRAVRCEPCQDVRDRCQGRARLAAHRQRKRTAASPASAATPCGCGGTSSCATKSHGSHPWPRRLA